jgi:uncharacterized membrane protein
MSAREWTFWIAATIVVAVLVHVGSVYAVPRVIMATALARLGEPNTMHFGRRPDATARAVVRPSPDLLYSTCSFDLSKGPLRVTAHVPHTTYWSVSAFDSATNNFFVKNDQEIAGDSLEVLLTYRGQALPRSDNALERITLFAPSEKGLILIRMLIDDDKHLPALQAIQRQAHCETVAATAGLR